MLAKMEAPSNLLSAHSAEDNGPVVAGEKAAHPRIDSASDVEERPAVSRSFRSHFCQLGRCLC